MNSMTGFGRAGFEFNGKRYSVEISSVNQKGLALGFYFPQEWSGAQTERALAPLVKSRVSRGKINVSVKAEAPAGTPEDFEINTETFKAVFEKMVAAAASVGVDLKNDPVTVMHAIDICNKRGGNKSAAVDEDFAARLVEGTRRALEAFVAMRGTEGENLKCDLQKRIDNLKALAEKIGNASAGTVAKFRETLLARLKSLGLETIDFNDERFVKEITIFADRCDISEERTRLDSHLRQFERVLETETDCGRKLDFICQEILRELNTMGSKANNIEITRLVVEAKNEQERLREQVQNVE